MSASRSVKFQLGLFVAALVISISPRASDAYTFEQQQACSGDAFRLCSSEIPDVGRITACMIARKSELSPGCRVFFAPDPDPAERADKPLRIKPTPQRRVRPHKRGRPAKADAT